MRISTPTHPTSSPAPIPGNAAAAALQPAGADYANSGALPFWTLPDLEQADRIALQARAARLAGDLEEARRLDAEFDALYDALEARIS